MVRRSLKRLLGVFLADRRRVPSARAFDELLQIGTSGFVEENGHAALPLRTGGMLRFASAPETLGAPMCASRRFASLTPCTYLLGAGCLGVRGWVLLIFLTPQRLMSTDIVYISATMVRSLGILVYENNIAV